MEVISPTITIKVVGFFLGGLNLYILNKMKDTILNGQKIICIIPQQKHYYISNIIAL